MPDDEATAALASAIARAIGLNIDPAWLPGVGRNLALLYEHAARVQNADVPAELHQAPVYRP